MSKGSWKRKIISCMKDKDIYDDSFLPVIDTLSEILDRRACVIKQFEEERSQYLITKTSDRGAKNTGKNPLLGIIQECERDALSYWTSLGLTPMSMKKLTKEEPKEELRMSPLIRAINNNVQKS